MLCRVKKAGNKGYVSGYVEFRLIGFQGSRFLLRAGGAYGHTHQCRAPFRAILKTTLRCEVPQCC